MKLSYRVQKLHEWWTRHGRDFFNTADDWIDSMSHSELLSALCWVVDDYGEDNKI